MPAALSVLSPSAAIVPQLRGLAASLPGLVVRFSCFSPFVQEDGIYVGVSPSSFDLPFSGQGFFPTHPDFLKHAC